MPVARFHSLDLFRGLTVALMILVNNPGTWASVWPPLRHAEWHGCTPTDLVFPFFLFAVGMSMWFSFEKIGHRLTATASKKIVKRGAIIFAIGLFLNAFPFLGKDWSQFRVLGVLQRIGMAYAIGAFLCLGLSRKALIWASMGILVGYFLGLWAWNPAAPFELGANLAGEFDRWILGDGHLYHGYRNAAGERVAFDPEGFLSTLPSAATVILGYLTGDLLDSGDEKSNDLKSRNLLAVGLSLVALGAFWSLFFPINKPIWTSSYVLFTGGLAILTVGFFVWIFDEKGMTSGTGPLVHLGMNPLFAYVLSSILAKTLLSIRWPTGVAGEERTAWSWIFDTVFRPIDGGAELSSFLFAASFVAVVWLACWALYRRKIFIKI